MPSKRRSGSDDEDGTPDDDQTEGRFQNAIYDAIIGFIATRSTTIDPHHEAQQIAALAAEAVMRIIEAGGLT